MGVSKLNKRRIKEFIDFKQEIYDQLMNKYSLVDYKEVTQIALRLFKG